MKRVSKVSSLGQKLKNEEDFGKVKYSLSILYYNILNGKY